MTREEALEILEEIKTIEDSIYQFNPKYLEALNLAIGALEKSKENEWIPIVTREPSMAERIEYLQNYGDPLCYVVENEMPTNGQEVLVSIGNIVMKDIFYEDYYNFESNDLEIVDAWMPLPKSYKEEE